MTIPMMNTSHILATSGLFSLNLEGSYNIFFCSYIFWAAVVANPSLNHLMHPMIHSRDSFLKIAITNIICIWTLIIAFPMKVAVKNILNGIRKWPHVIPARSNSGFGIEAQAKIVAKPYFYILSYITIFAFSIKVLFYLRFNYRTY